MEMPLAPRTAPDANHVNRLPCVFALPLGRRLAICECARRPPAGAHPGRALLCADPVARTACAEFDGLLREKSVFVLRRLPGAQGTTGNNQSRVTLHTAGLNGLSTVLDPEAPAPNVHHLVRLARQRHGSLANLPWEEIIRIMAAWRPGQRRAAPR